MLPWISVVVVLVAAYLTWNLSRRLRSDRITALSERRRAASRFVSRGELVDGNRHLAVALALTESTFFYENPEMEASIDRGPRWSVTAGESTSNCVKTYRALLSESATRGGHP